MRQSLYSDFLFASPSPVAGIARLMDFAGTYDRFNYSESEQEADARATLVDWTIVGNAIAKALEVFRREHHGK